MDRLLYTKLTTGWRPLVGRWMRRLVLTLVAVEGAQAGADTIQYCAGEYRYIDIEFMRVRGDQGCIGSRWPRAGTALGWTVAETPPDAPVEYVDELYTVCHGVGPEATRVVSRGRKIPRYRLTGKPHEFSSYVVEGGRKTFCRAVTYMPPPTAKRPPQAVIEQKPPLVFGPVSEGPVRVLASNHLIVGRQPHQLYGVLGDRQHADAAAALLTNRFASCREVDLGGFQCFVDGQDISVLLARNGLVRAYAQSTLPIREAEEQARLEGLGQWRSAAPTGVPSMSRHCDTLAASLERNREDAERDSRYAQRYERALERFERYCR